MYTGNYKNKTNILAQVELTAFTNTFLIGNIYSKTFEWYETLGENMSSNYPN